jgi:hypothetical protein
MFTFATIIISRKGQDWIAAPSKPGDTIDMTLRTTGIVGDFGHEIAGTMSGEVFKANWLLAPGGIDFGVASSTPAASLTGVVSRVFAFASGELTGAMYFRRSTGASATCPRAAWTLVGGALQAPVALLRSPAAR